MGPYFPPEKYVSFWKGLLPGRAEPKKTEQLVINEDMHNKILSVTNTTDGVDSVEHMCRFLSQTHVFGAPITGAQGCVAVS